MSKTFRIATLVAGVLLLVSGAAAAAEGEEGSSGFSFRVDPIVFSIVERDVDSTSAKFEEYRDIDSGFNLPWLRIFGESADGERYVAFRAVNAKRNDARYTLDYGVVGKYNLLVDYNKIIHRFGNDGRMLWTRTGPGRLEIADTIQQANQATLTANRPSVNFNFLNNLLAPYLQVAQDVDLSLVRDRTLVRFDLGKTGALSWGLEYTHENRNGTRPYGGSFGFNNATEFPEPIDYDTTGAEISGEWSTQKGGLRFGYRHSTFENNISTVIWDNPFRATDSTDPNAYTAPSASTVNGSALGFADLAADNEAGLFFLSGRGKFAGSWWAHGSFSYNTMTQDEPLLPYTLNSSIQGINFDGSLFDPTNAANLPARNADNKAVVTNLTAEVGSDLGSAFDLKFRYRYYDYDNKSKRIAFPGYVRFHAVWEDIGRITVPFSYTKTDAGAEVGWDVSKSTRVALSFNRESWDRTFREIETSDEDVLRLTVDSRPTPWLTLRGRYDTGDRSISHYEVEAQEHSFLDPGAPNNLPGLRKFDEAARKLDAYDFQAQATPGSAWSFSLGLNGRKEDYDESEFGLIDDQIDQYHFEIGYTPGEDLNFFLFGQRSDRDVFQRSRQSGATPSTNPADDWQVDFEEITDTWGLGLNAKLAERWASEVSANWSKSDGKGDFFSPPGGTPNTAVSFDNYEDIELLTLLGRLDYRVGKHYTVGLWYRYEDYTIDSFIFQGLRNYLPGILLLNANNFDYQADIYGLDLKLNF